MYVVDGRPGCLGVFGQGLNRQPARVGAESGYSRLLGSRRFDRWLRQKSSSWLVFPAVYGLLDELRTCGRAVASVAEEPGGQGRKLPWPSPNGCGVPSACVACRST